MSTSNTSPAAPDQPRPDDHDSASSSSSVLTVAVAAVVALVIGLGGGWLLFSPSNPGDDSPEAGFARDMSEHHDQAIEMSLLVLGRTDSDDVRAIATDILTMQGMQIGRMQGWLVTWGLPAARSSPERMVWMGSDHAHHAAELPPGVPMPGMASPEELDALAAADGEAAEILFLQLMLTHHIGGIDMADAVIDLGGNQEVIQMAGSMSLGQMMEIDLIIHLLEVRGAEPRESPEEIEALRAAAEDSADHQH